MNRRKRKTFTIKKLFTTHKKTIPLIEAIFFLLLSLFLIAGIYNIGGLFGVLIKNVFITYVGYSGAFVCVLFFSLIAYRKFFKKETSFLFWLSGPLALFSMSTFVAASASLYAPEKGGGSFGIFFAEKMQEWFSVLSYIILPFVFIFALFLMKSIPIKSLMKLWEIYNERKVDSDEEYEEEEEEEGEYEEEEEEYETKEPPQKEKKISINFGKKSQKETNEDISTEEIPIFTHKYTPPPISLLSSKKETGSSAGNTKEMAQSIQRTFKTFKINIQVEEIDIGPTVSRFAIKPEEGVKISRITGLQSNLELALAAHPIRIEAPIPGRSLVGIEIPNTKRRPVRIRSLLSSKAFKGTTARLPVAVGETVTGEPLIFDIAKLPHLLVAGTTGSGKSVLIHTILMSLIYARSPKDVRFLLVDPKKVELTLYDGIPHLYTSVITNANKAVKALIWAVQEMERRYDILEEHRVRDLESYNRKRLEWLEEKKEQDIPFLPYLVIVVDELADLMQAQPRELEASIVRLAQKSRAVGIHLILSTQRPSVNVITGLVKGNIPARIALRVPSQIDARTIMDMQGAETLLGNGDMLIRLSDAKKPLRVQGALVEEEEVKKVADSLISLYGRASIDPSITESPVTDKEDISGGVSLADIMNGQQESEDDDELSPQAKKIVIDAGKASTSLLQRRLRIGYSRAARLMDLLEDQGIIGPQDGSRPREVYISKEDTRE